MMYVLDTDVISQLVRKRPNERFLGRLRQEEAQALFTTVITVMELRYGSARRPDRDQFWARIADQVLSRVRLLRFDARAAVRAGDLQAALEGTGQPIGLADTQIAAISIEHDATLVTGNTRHFERVEGLRLDNWL